MMTKQPTFKEYKVKDIICYIPDLLAFRDEASKKAKKKVAGFSLDESGNLQYNVSKIPVHYSGLESICLLRLAPEELRVFNRLETCQQIGTCENGEYVFSVGGKAIYERVYDTSTRKIEIDGKEIDYTPPYMIGLFA